MIQTAHLSKPHVLSILHVLLVQMHDVSHVPSPFTTSQVPPIIVDPHSPRYSQSSLKSTRYQILVILIIEVPLAVS